MILQGQVCVTRDAGRKSCPQKVLPASCPSIESPASIMSSHRKSHLIMPIQRNSHPEHAKQQEVPPLSCQAIGSSVLIMPTHRKSRPNHAYLQELIPVPSHVNPYNPAPTHFNGTSSPAPFLEVRPRPLTCRWEAPPPPVPAPWGRCPCG